ncbi:hypothetical protein BVRB_4g082090 [Beta vulgaris subsp. vulgaris]|nr:hypothetical protein BVRB_4g082090 [Beta vulgaris subsp. vulgaris]
MGLFEFVEKSIVEKAKINGCQDIQEVGNQKGTKGRFSLSRCLHQKRIFNKEASKVG